MKAALLVIDVQNDYFPGGKYKVEQPIQALKTIKTLLRRFRASGEPVIFVQHIAAAGAAFFVPDSKGAELCPELDLQQGETLIVKHTPNSFAGTTLAETLEKQGTEELIVCGMMTQMCIDTTVRAARDRGYPVTLIADACAAHDLVWEQKTLPASLVQSVFLAALNGSFARVCSCAQYLAADDDR